MKNITLSLLIVSAFTLSCREEDPAWWDEPLGFAGDDALSGVKLPITLCTIANPDRIIAIVALKDRERVTADSCTDAKFGTTTHLEVVLEVQASSDPSRLPLGTIRAVDPSAYNPPRMLAAISEYEGDWILMQRFELVESKDGTLSQREDAIFDFPATWNGFREEIALNNADYSNRCEDWTPQDEANLLERYLQPGTACEREAELTEE